MARRICQHCGKPMIDGMTDLVGFYTHEGECFKAEMDSLYGEGMWHPVDDDGEGGYYVIAPKEQGGESEGTGIFYTSWADEEEEQNNESA